MLRLDMANLLIFPVVMYQEPRSLRRLTRPRTQLLLQRQQTLPTDCQINASYIQCHDIVIIDASRKCWQIQSMYKNNPEYNSGGHGTGEII